jgi:mono/diheme cytochrome c family protein
MSKIKIVVAMIFYTLVIGCDYGPKSSRGFSLPEGNVESGELIYTQLQCNACHIAAGIAQLTTEDEPEMSITLGGEVSRIKTYGELVTSIINPSHRLAKGYSPEMTQVNGESRMRNYNDVMTINQLVDLVTFLQAQYQLKVYTPTNYRGYYP